MTRYIPKTPDIDRLLIMIQKIVTKWKLQGASSTKEDVAYWLSRLPEEHIATVDY